MKRLIIYILLSTMFTISNAQEHDGIHRYNIKEWNISKKNFIDTIPIIFTGDQIFIPVYINGKRHLFNFDTGSSQGIAYYDTDTDYGRPLGNINSRDANGQTDTIPIVEFPEIHLGTATGLALYQYKASLLHRPKGHYLYDGIIGFDIVNKGIQVKIDTKAKHIILTDRKYFFRDEPGFEIKYTLKRWTPYLNIKPYQGIIDDKEQVLFDTGLPDLFVINKENFDKHRIKDPRIPSMVEETTFGSNAVGSYGAEKKGRVFYIKFPALHWDDFIFRSVHSMTTQGDSKIGAHILNYGTITFDSKKKKIKFNPYKDIAEIEADNKMKTITFEDSEEGPIVGIIKHSSTQYKKGFREGDIVLRINENNIRTVADIEENIHQKTVDKHIFILHDHRGFNKEVIIDKWE